MFGQTTGGVHEAELVDATSTEEFTTKLEACREVWDERELAVNPTRLPTFLSGLLVKRQVRLKRA